METHLRIDRDGAVAGRISPDRAPAADAPPPASAVVARERLHALAALAAARLDGAHEQRRLRSLDEAHVAGRRASRLLGEFTRHSVTECRGSHSTWDVCGDADAVFDALREYAQALDRVARAFPHVTRRPCDDR